MRQYALTECHQSLSAPFLIADLGAAACDLLPD